MKNYQQTETNPNNVWLNYTQVFGRIYNIMSKRFKETENGNPITWEEWNQMRKMIDDNLNKLQNGNVPFQIINTKEQKNESTHKSLSESQLHNIVKESIRKIIRESRELPEVHFCKSYRRGINETRFQVLCEYGDSIVAGCFDVDNSTNKLTFVSDFDTAPYNRETMIGDDSKRSKLSSEESAFIAKEILRTGQTGDLEDMWWYRKTEGIFRMMPR